MKRKKENNSTALIEKPLANATPEEREERQPREEDQQPIMEQQL
jgi:hypothetical protein